MSPVAAGTGLALAALLALPLGAVAADTAAPAAPPPAAASPQAAPPPAAAPAPAAKPGPPQPAPAPGEAAKPAPSEAAKPPPQAAKAPAPPKNLVTLTPGTVTAVLGKKVRDASGADMGMVVDVLVDANGIPLAAVIDFGGFLGVGSRKIAIDWELLQFNPDDQQAPITLALDRAEVQAAPEYKPSTPSVQIVGPPPAEGRSSVPASGK